MYKLTLVAELESSLGCVLERDAPDEVPLGRG
jgi:hypothetical protein